MLPRSEERRVGKETVGGVNGAIELGPYDEGRVDENGAPQ